jgi:hypothetical protein
MSVCGGYVLAGVPHHRQPLGVQVCPGGQVQTMMPVPPQPSAKTPQSPGRQVLSSQHSFVSGLHTPASHALPAQHGSPGKPHSWQVPIPLTLLVQT